MDHWPALCKALVDHGTPHHLVWILQCVYLGQAGEVVGDIKRSRNFNHRRCAARARAKSTFVLCFVVQNRAKMEGRGGNMGFHLMDGRPNLLDFCAIAGGSW